MSRVLERLDSVYWRGGTLPRLLYFLSLLSCYWLMVYPLFYYCGGGSKKTVLYLPLSFLLGYRFAYYLPPSS